MIKTNGQKKPWSLATFVLVDLCVLLVITGVIVRVVNLSYPSTKIFDEVYFPVFANDYLTRAYFFDVHPPLGKFLIAIGIRLFGNVSQGWRSIPALFGVANIGLMAAIWWQWQKDHVGAWMMAALISIECALIAYSRAGLMDGIPFFFIFACLWAAIRAKKEADLWLLATLFGLAISIKWVALAVIVPVIYIMWRKKMLSYFALTLVWSLAIYLIINLVGQLIIKAENPVLTSIKWNKDAFFYHLKLKDSHPWSSKWWTWPFMTRPVLFYYQETTNNNISVISEIGNPILWWTSSVTVVFSFAALLWQKFKLNKAIIGHPLVPLLLGYVAALLPWVLVSRVVFLYHYLPAYGFALLMVNFWLTRLWLKYPWLVILFMVICGASGLYFLPWVTGSALSPTWLAHHVWVKSWLY